MHTTSKVAFSDKRTTRSLCLFLFLFALAGCKQVAEPVTITFLDPEGLLDLGEHHMVSDAYLQEFTKQTGIRVNHLPTPEDNRAQLRLTSELLQSGATTPDVYGVDTIWSGVLSPYLIDLKSYVSPEISPDDPEVLASYMVQGKLVAMPYHPNVGVLYYRTDLLRKYGYSGPPRTWDQLKTMSERIQKGERARGNKDFWGFIWPGTTSESLAVMGTEWQVGDGGGRIIEADQKISVNNANVIHVWQRAADWVGSISPPTVLSYTEWDASNAFWIAGNAAFLRGWSDYFQRHPRDVPFHKQAGVTSVPADSRARVSTLGGYALAVSKSSAHPAESIRLVQFLAQREAQFESAESHTAAPKQLEFYELPTMLAKRYPWPAKAAEEPGGTVVSRPSTVAGANYQAVSRAYVAAVRSVLTRQSTADHAAAALQKELVRITGFAVSSPPSRPSSGPGQ